jgi:EmrB/QacA subfamily drug resistance transporter
MKREQPSPEELQARRWKIFGVMMIGWAMSLLDVSIVNISIPELQRRLDADLATVSWVVNAYNLVFAVLLVPMGRLADQFGRKRFFLIGMGVFTLGSLACALSWSIGALIGFRVLQGVGAGTLAPLGFAMTALVFPPAKRGLGLALIAVVALVSAATGPVLGGVLVELASWHWIFLINVPFGILGILLCLRWWPETWDPTAGRNVDWLGMVLLGGSVFCLTYALVEGNSRGWGDALILWLLQLSLLLAVGFVLAQRFGRAPMLTRELGANRQFVGANAALLLFGAGAIGVLFLLALVFVNLWGYSQIEAALALTPVPLCGLLVWPLVGRAADRAPPRRIAIPALLLSAAGMIWLSFLPAAAPTSREYLHVLPGLILVGFGIGSVFPIINVAAMGSVVGPQVGLASGIVNTARQIGAAIGVALMVAVFATVADHRLAVVRDRIGDAAYDAAIPAPVAGGLVRRTFAEFSGADPTRHLRARPGFDRVVQRETADAARDSYGWAFRAAALALLLAIPCARTMRRTPSQARAHAAAAPAAPPIDGRGGLEVSIGGLEASLSDLRSRRRG